MKRTVIFSSLTLILLSSISTSGKAQQLHMGLFADPVISWYSSNSEIISGGGARAGFSGGLAVNYYFAPNYAFSTGLNFTKTGGVQTSSEETTFSFANYSQVVTPGQKAIYSVSHLSIPAGLRLRTNQIGYLAIFSDIGFDAGVLTKGTISIPSASIDNEHASKEIPMLTLGFHIHAGTEYSLGGSTVLVIGIGYDRGLTDITKDLSGQTLEKTTASAIRLKLGLFF